MQWVSRHPWEQQLGEGQVQASAVALARTAVPCQQAASTQDHLFIYLLRVSNISRSLLEGGAHTWPHCPSHGRRCFSVGGPALKVAPPGVCLSSVQAAAKRLPCCKLDWAMSAAGLRAEPLMPGRPAAPSFSRSASFSLQQTHSV